MEGTPCARLASRRPHGTLEGVPENKLDESPDALGWRLGRFNCAILPRESRDKKGQWGAHATRERRARRLRARPERGHHAQTNASNEVDQNFGRIPGRF